MYHGTPSVTLRITIQSLKMVMNKSGGRGYLRNVTLRNFQLANFELPIYVTQCIYIANGCDISRIRV